MKTTFFLLSLLFVLSSEAQIMEPMTSLFNQYALDTKAKTPEEVTALSLANYQAFIDINVNSHDFNPQFFNDLKKPRLITKADAQVVLAAMNDNPVVSSWLANYDPENKGIGFCFGRAMFANIYLASAGLDRGSIKKAFVVGPMLQGAWGWHVATIAQSKVDDRETWLVIDPVIGVVMSVEEWYAEIREMSDDGKLMLYVAQAGKFGAGPSNYNEVSFIDPFYNSYFIDMMKWFSENEVQGRLKF